MVMVVVASGIITPLQQASAMTQANGLSPGDAAKSFTYYKALRHCMDTGSYSNSYFLLGSWQQYKDMDQDKAVSFEWFSDQAKTITSLARVDNTVTTGVINASQDNGVTNCGGSKGKAWIAAAAGLWGYNSGPELLCALGFTREVPGSTCASAPAGAGNKFYAPDNASGKLDAFWKSKNSSTGVGSITAKGGEYRLYFDSFQAACLPSSISYTIQAFSDGATTPSAKTYQASSQGKDGNTNVRLYQDNDINCSDLAGKLKSANSDTVLGYITYLKANKGIDVSLACNGKDSTCAASTTATSCVIDGVGWIICSMANFMASVSDGIYSLIENLLKVPVINTDTGSTTNGVYNAWAIMRNLANVIFVISFLIIIFSQMTSVGITNYGVKKTLPRLVIAAILVNVSFWVSAVAVDVSNILGSGIYDLLSGVKDTMHVGISSNWGNIITGLLAGGALSVTAGVVGATAGAALIASGGASAILFLAIPLVLGAVLAVLIAGLVLIARQALVVIFIILSPLAFVALLLPNTEKLFAKWKSGFISLLIMYPMISIIFGGAQIAGLAILSTAGSGDAISTTLAIVVGQTVMVIPFFFIPALITKFSGDNLNGLISTLNSKGKGLIGGASGFARKEGQSRFKRGLSAIKYGNNEPTNRVGRAFRKYGRKFDQTKDQQGNADKYLEHGRSTATRDRIREDNSYATASAAGDVAAGEVLRLRAEAAGIAEEDKDAKEAISATGMSGLERQTLATTGTVTLHKGTERETTYSNKSLQRAAIQEQFRTGSYGQQVEIIEASADGGKLNEYRQTIAENAAPVMGTKDPALSGKRIDEISQGKFNYKDAVKVALDDGKYTAEAFAKMNDDARQQVIEIANAEAAAGEPKYLNILKQAAQDIVASPQVKATLSTSTKATAQINDLLPPAPPTAPPTPPTSPTGGSGPSGLVIPHDNGFNDRN